MNLIDQIFLKAIAYDAGDPARIQHFVKVHGFARQIGRAEGLDDEMQRILEIAAVLHDIGIHASEEKYGDCIGKHQEELGPGVARALLADTEVIEEETERICYLIAHHHTYSSMDGMDYQILVEADFLVNMFEDNMSSDRMQHIYKTIFRTATGRQICRDMFQIE